MKRGGEGQALRELADGENGENFKKFVSHIYEAKKWEPQAYKDYLDAVVALVVLQQRPEAAAAPAITDPPAETVYSCTTTHVSFSGNSAVATQSNPAQQPVGVERAFEQWRDKLVEKLGAMPVWLAEMLHDCWLTAFRQRPDAAAMKRGGEGFLLEHAGWNVEDPHVPHERRLFCHCGAELLKDYQTGKHKEAWAKHVAALAAAPAMKRDQLATPDTAPMGGQRGEP